jgi:pantothenate kinase type III
MKLQYIKASAVRAEAKAHGKRASKDFIEALDRLVGRKTMDAGVAGFVLGYLEKK